MLDPVKRIVKTTFRLCGLNIESINAADNNYDWLLKYDIGTVLDIGANTGQFARWIRSVLPDARLYSFEPIKECYDKLIENMAKAPNFHAFNYALGDTDTDQEMHVNAFTPSSSLLPMASLHKRNFPYTAAEHLEKVEVKRLDVVAEDLELTGNLLIKIDVQGYEDRVIQGGQNVMSRAKVLIVETSFKGLYIGQPMFEDIYDMLRQIGFRFMGALEQLSSPIDGSVLQADSVFIKNLGN